jgi:hypothetical protein
VIAKVSARGHDRHDALPREPLYEQVSALGYIDYNGGLEVHSSLLDAVLHEKPQTKNA